MFRCRSVSKNINVVFFILLFLCFSHSTFCQNNLGKKIVRSSDIASWPRVDFSKVTNDGRFFCYFIASGNSGEGVATMQSLDGSWKRNFPSSQVRSLVFTDDSKKALFTKGKDSLCILQLGDNNEKVIGSVLSFKITTAEREQWLAFRERGKDSALILQKMTNGAKQRFLFVSDYRFIKDKLFYVQRNRQTGMLDALYFDFKKNTSITFWSGFKIGEFACNGDSTKIGFIGVDESDKKDNGVVYCYDLKISQLTGLTQRPFIGNMNPARNLSFSENSELLYFDATERKNNGATGLKGVQVDIWHYKDPSLQSLQLLNLPSSGRSENNFKYNSYTFVVSLKNKKCIRLEYDKQSIEIGRASLNLSPNNFIIRRLISAGFGSREWYWNKLAIDEFEIISAKDTTWKMRLGSEQNVVKPCISPDEKYCLFYNPDIRQYISVEIATGTRRVLTKGINTSWTSYDQADELWSKQRLTMGIAGWEKTGRHVLIYDQNDIFFLDITGVQPPVNLTNGYGKKNNIVFRLAMEPENSQSTIYINKKILLSAFNRFTKDDGFFWLDCKTKTLEKASMQPKRLEGTGESMEGRFRVPIKANNAEIYFLKIESEEEFPNLFSTSDFKQFKPVTNFQPHKEYNWLTSELVTWTVSEGRRSQGILYKPENFDSRKQYPMIVLYYETYSNGLHLFDLMPNNDGAKIRIQEYVSDGYLVFVPDTKYSVGNPGQDAYNCIMSGVNQLMRQSWVDAKHIGLNGHSFGGYKTEYMVTHTNMFAAACANSGWSMFTGTRVRTNGTSTLDAYETGKQRMGANMWERPDRYIQASPMFQAHKVTTPLLMMNNKADRDIVFEEGVQFFVALRRLGKKSWMLQYDNEGHGLYKQENERDLSIRMHQFFDHYLKGAPAPKWMLDPIPAIMKGIDDGLTLDKTGRTPEAGILTGEAQKKVDNLLNRKPITVKID